MAARRGDAIVALVAICAALATLPDARVHGFKANDYTEYIQWAEERSQGCVRC